VETVGIIGAGAWGTALAAVAAQAGRRVVLWALEAEVIEAINADHTNPVFLPDFVLPENVHATGDVAEAARCDALLLVAPAQHMRGVTESLARIVRPGTPVVICAKGIEQSTLKLMSEVVAETLPQAVIAVLSGPTFAREVADGHPTAVTLASANEAVGLQLVESLGQRAFRPYLSTDVVGAQIGGAVKNVLAIACGIVEGRAFGENTRAALMTRGLAEILRLGDALGANRDTLMGLSGLGDLILTCSSAQSRNTSLGMALGRGRTLAQILGRRRSVAEGVYSASAAVALAARHGVDMPICAAVDAVLNRGAAIDAIVEGLLTRSFKHEISGAPATVSG
jgi:glycerol-3-phosphate dehydrogenase (NAD(P)+)